MNKIIDAHLHLDEKISSNLSEVVASLDRDLIENDISSGVVLHLLAQGWRYQEVGTAIAKTSRLKAFQNIDPNSPTKNKDLEDGVRNYGFIGLKLHPRLQRFSLQDPKVTELCQYAGQLNIPVLIDAFPDGTALQDGFNVLDYSRLAQSCPGTRFIWAHFGGHYVLDFMMVAKRLPNVFLDISYSWLYYRDSAVPLNFAYAMKSMKFSKIFYGSDYPDRSISNSTQLALEAFNRYDIQGEDLHKILFANAREFFNGLPNGTI